MDRLLTCDCGREHVVSPSQAGQEIKCDCGKILPVPTLRGLSELPLAQTAPGAESVPSARGARANSSGWEGWRGPAIALTSAGMLIACAACGWYLLQRWTVNTSHDVQAEIQAGERMLADVDPSELSATFDAFGQMGLRAKEPPNFHLWNLYADSRVKLAKISGAIAGVFAVLTFLLWVTVGKQPA